MAHHNTPRCSALSAGVLNRRRLAGSASAGCRARAEMRCHRLFGVRLAAKGDKSGERIHGNYVRFHGWLVANFGESRNDIGQKHDPRKREQYLPATTAGDDAEIARARQWERGWIQPGRIIDGEHLEGVPCNCETSYHGSHWRSALQLVHRKSSTPRRSVRASPSIFRVMTESSLASVLTCAKPA